jgi:UDP-glucose 4-epimerase
MAKSPRPSARKKTKGALSVALTGTSGRLGAALLERLLADKSFSRVVVFDLQPPAVVHSKLHYQPLDLTSASADRVVGEALAVHSVEALAHLPILTAPSDPAYAHEVEAIGTLRVLAGLAQSSAHRLVMVSTTSVYGALPTNPNHLDEERPLPAFPRSRYLSDKVEMERQVNGFAAAHADRVVTILRFPPIVGPSVFDPFAGYLSRMVAPVVLGHDPLVQLVHVEDALQAIVKSLAEDLPGTFNVGSRGVLPLSAVLKLAGVRRLPLPHLGTGWALRLTNLIGLTQTPPALLDYVRYLCVADLRKAEQAGLGGEHAVQDAVCALGDARKARSLFTSSETEAEAEAV